MAQWFYRFPFHTGFICKKYLNSVELQDTLKTNFLPVQPQTMTRPVPSCLLYLLITMACFTSSSCCSGGENAFLEDRIATLTAGERQRIVSLNRILLTDLDIHFKLIILGKKTNEINGLAADIFNNLGEQTRGAKGLLFLVDPAGRQVRIEVGYDLEAVYPDNFVSYLEHKQMAGFFEAGRIGAGIEATTELLVARMQQAIAGNEFDARREFDTLQHFSGGGGAEISVEFKKKLQRSREKSHNVNRYQPGNDPESALLVYKRVLQKHVKNPDLLLYTPETRQFFATWIVTDAQQNNELQGIEKNAPEKIITSGNFAVIRYPASERTQPPYFLEKGDQGWMLDFQTMSRVIRMSHKNMWMLKSREHPYMFGFADWKFDKNGFPILQR